MTYKRACLIVIDGWGSRDESHGNAIMEAETPVMDAFKEDSDHYGIIGAAGLYVGLPDGTMGNSEVGHLTIGAGAVDYQDLVKINKSISEKTLSTRPALVDACKAANAGTGRLHLWGLLSDGGVHSHNQHIYALIEAIKGEGVKELFLHCCMDGRDTAPTSGGGYMKELEDKLAELDYGKVASVMGRYYAMDRDKRWERVQKAYDVMCRASGGEAKWAGEYDKEVKAYDVEAGKVKDLIEAMHGQKMTDEFIEPTGVCPGGGIADGDVFFCFNFRADRAKEMFECIAVKPLFDSAVERKPGMTVSMTKLSAQFADLGIPTIFPPGSSSNGLSETVSKLGLTQYHSAETEKFAHVTFFFNGGREEPFEGEVRQLEDSPKVATYDLAPKMTVEKVANNMVAEIEAGKHTFLVCNLAAPDMVGHTGYYDKAMIAAAHTDECIGKIAAACKEKGVGLFITADHGNCETMLTEEGKPMTSHSCTPVPFVCQTGEKKVKRSVADRKDAGVADIAPTMLTYMGIPVPKEMTGESWID